MANTKRATLTVREVEALLPGQKLVERLGGKGQGSLVLRARGSGTIEAYHRRAFRRMGKSHTESVKLGTLKVSNRPGIGLADLRSMARELVENAGDGTSIKEHLARQGAAKAAQAAAEEEARREVERQREIEAGAACLLDLLNDYIDHRKTGNGRQPVSARQAKEWQRMIDRDFAQSKHILKMKAKDIGPTYITGLLRPVFEHGTKRPRTGRGSKGRVAVNGARGQADKIRTFLHAAFVYGLQAEHTLGRTSDKLYGLTVNPVSAVSVTTKSEPGKRALNQAELHRLWSTIVATPNVGPIRAKLIRFCIALGGQRPEQIQREPWSSYNFDDATLRLVERKGRGGIERTHLVPLSSRALAILKEVKELTGKYAWPWTTTGKAPMAISTPSHTLREWLGSNHAIIDGTGISHFSARDLRRTCSQLMQAAGVPDDLADLLQSHGISGIVAVHYRNNPTHYLKAKRKALRSFDRELTKIIDAGVEAS